MGTITLGNTVELSETTVAHAEHCVQQPRRVTCGQVDVTHGRPGTSGVVGNDVDRGASAVAVRQGLRSRSLARELGVRVCKLRE